MAKKDILSTSEFLAQMRKTPLGSTTDLTFGDAQVLSRSGIDVSNYGNEDNEYEEVLKDEKESTSFWENLFGTIDSIANSFGKGFVSAFEGIIDAGAWIAGEVGSWFGAETQWAEDFIKIDMASNLANFTEAFANWTPWGLAKTIKNWAEYGDEYWQDFGKAWSSLGLGIWGVTDAEFAEWQEKYSFSHDVLEKNTGWFGKAVLGVAEAGGQLVGEILGAKGMGAIMGAAGEAGKWSTKAVQTAQKAGTLAMLGVSAAGQGTQEALQDGAEYNAAGLYGLLTGATEVATEMVGGVLTDVDSGAIGKLMRKSKTGNKILDSMVGSIIMNGLSEGFEEVLSDVANPLWKKISYDPDLDLENEYTSKEFWSGVAMSFTVGSVIGAIGSTPRAYRANKFSINGKQAGATTYNNFSEFSEKNTHFKEMSEKVFSTIAEVQEAGHEFKEGTDFRTIANEVQNADDISDNLKKKLGKTIEIAEKAANELDVSYQKLEKQLDSKGITMDDLIEQYGKDMAQDIKDIQQRLKVEIVSDGENFIDMDGKIHIGTAENVQETQPTLEEETTPETVEKELTIESTLDKNTAEPIANIAEAVIRDKFDLRQRALKFENEELRAKWTEKARQDPTNIGKPNGVKEFIDTNIANEILNAITQDAPKFTTTDGLRELADILETADDIEEARQLIYENRDLPISKSIDVTNKAKQVKRGRWSSGIESFMNKIIDAQYTLRNTLKQLGDSESQAQQYIGRAVSSSSVGLNIAANGYCHIDADGKIVNDSVGIYGAQNNNIVNRIQVYAKENNLDFFETLSKIERLLTLEHSIDRVNQGKSVFGKFVTDLWVNKQFLSKSYKYLRPVYDMFSHANTISETEWNNFKETLEFSEDERISNLQQEIIEEVESHMDELTEEQTKAEIKKIKEELPLYDELKADYRKFMDNVLQERVDAGMITQETADSWKEMYPNYVPTSRVMVGTGSNTSVGSLLSTDIKKAKGSNLVVQDIFASSMTQSQHVHHFHAVNEVLNHLYDLTQKYQEKTGDFHPNVQILNTEDSQLRVESIDDIIELSRPQFDPTNNRVTLYKNGQAITMQVSETLFESLVNLDRGYKRIQSKLGILKFTEKTAQTMRQLMTNWNPFFSWWRNPIKDIQSAILYTKNGTATLLRNIPRSFQAVFSETFGKGENQKLVQLYKTYIAEGGQASNITALNMYEEINFNEKKFRKIIRKISTSWSNFNEIMENTTRFAEFISTYERLTKANTDGKLSQKAIVQEALNDAREITINFARKGTWTQVINKFVPFLTANIEGAARNVRAFISPRSKKELAMIIIKMLILGIVPQAIQELIYGNDEAYQGLTDTMKSNYYLFKIGDEFIRIPKGYIQQAFSSAVVTVSKKAHGENIDKEDIMSMLENQWNAIGVDVSGVFFQPIIDAKNNRTWYGGEIVPQKYDNTRPSEQYDRNTSAVAKFIGKITGWSPMKIDYVLDQMTGIVGDIILPATSEEGYNPTKFLKDQFVTDSTYKNRNSSEFHDYKMEVMYDKTDGDAIATVVATYLNKVSNKVSDLKKQQDELISSDMSETEKSAQDKLLQGTINATYKAAIINAEKLKVELANYELSEESIDQDRLEAYRQVLGAEFALESYNSKVYKRAQIYYKAGVSYDNFYVYYFNMKNLPDRQSVENYIARLRIKPQLKNLLYRLMGYRLDDDKVAVLKRWLKNLGITDEEIEELL